MSYTYFSITIRKLHILASISQNYKYFLNFDKQQTSWIPLNVIESDMWDITVSAKEMQDQPVYKQKYMCICWMCYLITYVSLKILDLNSIL